MSYVRVWIHAVWGTKCRAHILTKEIRPRILNHIRQNAKQKEVFVDRLNGFTDHVDCLFALNADMTTARVLQLLKGESAYWINEEKVTPPKFEWANEYYAVSVSESGLDAVRAYIDNQEVHHRKLSYEEEVVEFLRRNYTKKSWLKPSDLLFECPHHKWWGYHGKNIELRRGNNCLDNTKGVSWTPLAFRI